MSDLIDHNIFLRPVAGRSFDRAHAGHVAAQACGLFDGLAAYHGLPPSTRRLALAAGALHDIAAEAGKTDHHTRAAALVASMTDLPLAPTERRIVAAAVALHAGRADLDAFIRARRAEGDSAALTGRIAAVVRIADGLDHSRTQATRLEHVVNDAPGLNLTVAGPAAVEDAAAAEGKADLWNRLDLRPIRSIRPTG